MDDAEVRGALRARRRSHEDSSLGCIGGFGDLSLVFRRLESPVPGLCAFLNQVVNQTNTVSFVNGQRLVFAISVKRHVRKLREFGAAGIHSDFAAGMPNPQLAAAMCRRQRDDKRPEHSISLLSVPVRKKKAV